MIFEGFKEFAGRDKREVRGMGKRKKRGRARPATIALSVIVQDLNLCYYMKGADGDEGAGKLNMPS